MDNENEALVALTAAFVCAEISHHSMPESIDDKKDMVSDARTLARLVLTSCGLP